MTLQSSMASCDEMTVRMVAHSQSQQNVLPVSHVLSGFSTIDNTQIQPTMSLTMVPTMVPAAQSIDASQVHNITTVAVPANSTAVGMQQINHMILQSPKVEHGQRDQERRIRREIANSNERRRMQSINAGFKSLKSILPHTDGEKLSKAAILQQTSEYITQLESDKLRLMHQNEKLRQAFTDCKCNLSKHRVLADIFEKDEGIGSPAEEDFEDVRRALIDLRQQLEKERRMRNLFEEQVRSLEYQLYPDRVQCVKLSSSDERRSSSECSPSDTKPMTSLPNTTKLQPCARPLLPPLAPILSKGDKTDAVSLPQPTMKPTVAFSMYCSSSSPIQSVPSTINMVSAPQCKVVEASKEFLSPSHSEQSVTFFSHSTKSNQPLKKRAIEIHHQSLTDSSADSTSRQPQNKIAKITIDQPSDIGTRSFLPPTLPLIHADLGKSMSHVSPSPQRRKVHTAASPSTVTLQLPGSNVPPVFSPPASLSYLKSNPLLMSPPTNALPNSHQSQIFGSPYTLLTPTQPTPGGSNQPTVMIPSVPRNTGLSGTPTRIQNLNSPYAQVPMLTEDIRGVVDNNPCQEEGPHGNATPLYLTVGGLQPHANIAYIQRDGDKLVQLAPYPQPHFIVSPVSNHNTVLMATSPPDQSPMATVRDPRPQMMTQQAMDPDQNVGAKDQPTVISYHDAASQAVTIPTPLMQHRMPSTNPSQMTPVTHPQSLLPSVKFQNTIQKIQNPNPAPPTVLCYSQPEITLNQLNAVPNLAPPRSFHQPMLLPITSSIIQTIGSNSPSYMSPALQESAIQQKHTTYVNPSALRCRKSSLSATDSCSTASVSGAEDEELKITLLDDADCQSGESNPTKKLSNVKQPERLDASHSKSPPRAEPVAAYDEVSQDGGTTPEEVAPPQGIDVADCPSPPSTDATVSVLSNVAGSPPVIRHIDAIQTRRNLETIVQAIDHLEQQERRNSQDRSEVSGDGSH